MGVRSSHEFPEVVERGAGAENAEAQSGAGDGNDFLMKRAKHRDA